VNSELARRIAFTLGALLIFRSAPTSRFPDINPAVWAQVMRAQGGGMPGHF